MHKNGKILPISARSFREKPAFLQSESAWIKQEISDLPHKSLIEMKKCGSQNLFCGLKIFFCALHLEQMQAAKFILQAAFLFLGGKHEICHLSAFHPLPQFSPFSLFCHVEYRHFGYTHLHISL